jgi:hypothetical protein
VGSHLQICDLDSQELQASPAMQGPVMSGGGYGGWQESGDGGQHCGGAGEGGCPAFRGTGAAALRRRGGGGAARRAGQRRVRGATVWFWEGGPPPRACTCEVDIALGPSAPAPRHCEELKL